jgi:hypothetical protein
LQHHADRQQPSCLPELPEVYKELIQRDVDARYCGGEPLDPSSFTKEEKEAWADMKMIDAMYGMVDFI